MGNNQSTIKEISATRERITLVEYPLLPNGILAKRVSTGEILFVETLRHPDEFLLQRLNAAFDVDGDNVLRYYDVDGDRVFREIYDITLTEFLKRKQLLVGEALSLMLQCASGIKTLRANDVEHWKLSTDNIGIKGSGVVKIFDYYIPLPRPQTTAVLPAMYARMTPENERFLAPEIYTLPKADIYSLACVFEEILKSTPQKQQDAETEITRALATTSELINNMKDYVDVRRPDIDVVIETLQSAMTADTADGQPTNYSEMDKVIKSYEGIRRLSHIHFNIALIGCDYDTKMQFIKEMQFRQPEITQDDKEAGERERKVFYVEFPWMPNIKIWYLPEVGSNDTYRTYVSNIPWRIFEFVVVVGRSTRIPEDDVSIVKALKEKKIQYVYVRTDQLEPFTDEECTLAKTSISQELKKPEYFESHPPQKFFFIPTSPTAEGHAVGDRGEMFEFIRSKFNRGMLKPVEVKIAFVGDPGAGKSTTINALRGVREGDEGAAKTARYSTGTREVTPYTLPKTPHIKLYDFPGIAPDFSIDKCRDEIERNVLKESCFLVFHNKGKEKNLQQVTRLLQDLKCKFVVVRSFFDVEIEEVKKKEGIDKAADTMYGEIEQLTGSFKEMADTIYSEIEQLTQITKERVFLINAKEPDQFDHPKLMTFILKCLSLEEQEAFLENIGLISLSSIDAIEAQLLQKRWGFAQSAGAAGLIPIPGLSTGVDISLLALAYMSYIKAFKLDDASLQDLAARSKVSPLGLRSCITSPVKFDQTSLKSILIPLQGAKVGMQLLTIEGLSEGAKFIPVIGTIIGGAVNAVSSFGLTAIILQRFIRDLKIDAIAVYEYARDAQLKELL